MVDWYAAGEFRMRWTVLAAALLIGAASPSFAGELTAADVDHFLDWAFYACKNNVGDAPREVCAAMAKLDREVNRPKPKPAKDPPGSTTLCAAPRRMTRDGCQ
jgi:hypothetical protein